jgi:SAM-dependent methyltransferase
MAVVQSAAYTLEDQERMTRAKRYFAWQSRLVTRELGRRVIEVGCGIGNFTSMLLDRDAVVALDVEPGCIERLKQRYPGRPNLQAFTWDANSDPPAELTAFRADSCVCLNVLEHIENDRKALTSMASFLAPGGSIVLLIPAFPSLYGPIDRNLCHYRRYTRQSIAKLAETCGLHVAKAHYMNAVGFFGWWTNSHLWKREAQSERQIEVFDRCIVPLMSRMEDLIRPPFGQSLFVVLRKPAPPR